MSWTVSQVLKLGPPKDRTEVLTTLWQHAVGYLYSGKYTTHPQSGPNSVNQRQVRSSSN